MANQQVPQQLTKFMLKIGDPQFFLFLSCMVILIGCALLDGLPAIIILYPILLPIAVKLGLTRHSHLPWWRLTASDRGAARRYLSHSPCGISKVCLRGLPMMQILSYSES
jgi:TRAP-type mannitol/chloroaromatic compound transport system permease large subunit